MIRPLKGKVVITNPFGAKGYGVFGRHAGVDYRASIGTNIYAPGDGVVTDSYNGTNGIKVLQVDIGNKSHRFLHLNDRSVKKGQKVKQGQLLGHTGNTGNVAAHLHWDVRKKGTAWNRSFSDYYNPEKLVTTSQPVYLRVRAGEGLSALARRSGFYRLSYWLPTTWAKIAKLNGSSDWRKYNSSLKVGQKVRVK